MAVPVSVYKIVPGTATYFDVYPATVTPLNLVDLRPEVSGYLTDIYFKDGQHVSKGMKLYGIDQRQYKAAYDQAIANNTEFYGKKQIRIFLTPTGKISQKSPEWQSLSYKNLVTAGFDTLKSGGLSNIARENLKRFLMDLLLGPFEKAESEIQEIIAAAEKVVYNTNVTDRDKFVERLHFDQLVSDNRLLVDLLMEG